MANLEKREAELLDERSKNLKLYLMENVIPILSQGILEVCQKCPEDPVDYLAEFLFERSMQVPFKDPSKYNNQ